MKYIVLDSTPLGLLTQRQNAVEADACRQWLADKTSHGLQIIVPEIVDYELRRELIRSRKIASLKRLDQFLLHPTVTFLAINTAAMQLAAQLWARSRQQGNPTADPHAVDVDVILAAQILATGIRPEDFTVVTSNVTHISLFVPASRWTDA